ncbi:triphosphoribosyl-dephospho-CoA synthase [Chromobacterium sp. Beijing]|uniref:triphosphoribosyl-dephospho-CoA synthase n=1 Tax=Chromobacterium sp. Beijing TaxID=2735795 RepID=UPI001F39B79F|nr:triphosphoribosyl-dephospho-CoA synthase [Chromobacterium sp. Beijing]UJB32174.1 triphosphoribosyl-dephospho-CoA synthase [Chromobacterium sp. Beijing]
MPSRTERRARRLSPEALADAAVAALLAEAALTPKPGLVDQRGGGAHQDMDWALLRSSAQALRPGFLAMAEAGAQEGGSGDLPRLRARIGLAGRQAEAAMLAASGGINTHRGAIWALGLLVTAAAAWPGLTLRTLALRAGGLARIEDPAAPPSLSLPGGRVCARYGVGGARRQAIAGFPQVIDHGLPALQAARRRGVVEGLARLDALLAIMRQLDDTCLLARGGRRGLVLAQGGAAAVLRAGGCASEEGWRLLLKLDQSLRRRRLSPGGAADLLAATLMLDGLAQAPAKEGLEWNATHSLTPQRPIMALGARWPV